MLIKQWHCVGIMMNPWFISQHLFVFSYNTWSIPFDLARLDVFRLIPELCWISVSWKEIRGFGSAIGNCKKKKKNIKETLKLHFTRQQCIYPRHPTLYCVPRRRFASSFGLITDPLLAALSPDFDPAWGLAPHPRRLGLCAQRNTANGTVHTHALVFAAGLEALPITVDHTIMLTACSHHIWQRGTTSSHRL